MAIKILFQQLYNTIIEICSYFTRRGKSENDEEQIRLGPLGKKKSTKKVAQGASRINLHQCPVFYVIWQAIELPKTLQKYIEWFIKYSI